MNKIENLERNHTLESNSYKIELWNYLRNKENTVFINADKQKLTRQGAPYLDNDSLRYFQKTLKEKSVLRKVASYFEYELDSVTIATFFNNSIALWRDKQEQNLFSDFLESNIEKVKYSYNSLSNFLAIHEDFLLDHNAKIDKFILDTFAHNFAKAEDKAFIIGDGNGEPLGILVDEKIKSLSATKELKLDDLKKLFFSLDSEYRENAKWIMNDKTALYLQSLKDSQGNFLWNQYDGTFMGKEILISNFMPDIDAGKKPVAFGDFSNYWIIERQNPTIKRLEEVFVLKQHQGFIMREYLDAKLMDKDSVLTLSIDRIMPMVKNKKDDIKKSENIEVSGTIFTVHSMKSENAKNSVEQIIRKLILNNVDALNRTNLSA